MASSAPSRLAGPVALGLFEVDVVERAGTPRRNGAITVVAAVEQAAQTRRGRIGLSALRDPGALQVVDFTRRTVQSNATVRTSADAAFGQLGPAGFVHETFESTPDSDVVPDALIDLESALVSWLTGNLHRGVSDVHLGWYLAEIAFRWNVPSDAGSGARFDRLLEPGRVTSPCRSRPHRTGGRSHHLIDEGPTAARSWLDPAPRAPPGSRCRRRATTPLRGCGSSQPGATASDAARDRTRGVAGRTARVGSSWTRLHHTTMPNTPNAGHSIE